MDNYTMQSFKYSHIFLHNFGEEQCYPSHYFPPTVRDFYLLHYIISGKGTFSCSGKTYNLGAGNMFFISPGELVAYSANSEDPWRYMWVGFHGDDAEQFVNEIGFSQSNPIQNFPDNKNIVKYIGDMISIEQTSLYGTDCKLQGLLYMFLGELLSQKSGQSDISDVTPSGEVVIQKSIQFMTSNFSSPNLTVAFLAHRYNFDRSYFSRIFKEITGITPHQYLLNIRMQKALELLFMTNLSITQVANSVGYNDYVVFSKSFKAKQKCSPKQLRTYKNFFLNNPVGVLPPELHKGGSE